MTGRPMGQDGLQAGSPLSTPGSAAVAGIVFSLLLISALVLLRLSVPAHPQVAGTWLTDSGRRTAVAIGLNLIPFAGLAFLWFIGVIRDRIGMQQITQNAQRELGVVRGAGTPGSGPVVA